MVALYTSRDDQVSVAMQPEYNIRSESGELSPGTYDPVQQCRQAMKVLGKTLVAPFAAFWAEFSSEIDIPFHLIEEGHWRVFGPECYHQGSGSLPSWLDLPNEALSYHVSHELTHLLMRKRGYPISVRGIQYSEGSPQGRVGGDLEEMISHPALEEILAPFPFDKTHIQQHLSEEAGRGLESSPVPESGTPWWATWACRFCELHFLLPHRQWLRLEVVYDGRCPDIADKGRELIAIMEQEGFTTPDQALKSMIRARDSLGLDKENICLVLDPRDSRNY